MTLGEILMLYTLKMSSLMMSSSSDDDNANRNFIAGDNKVPVPTPKVELITPLTEDIYRGSTSKFFIKHIKK